MARLLRWVIPTASHRTPIFCWPVVIGTVLLTRLLASVGKSGHRLVISMTGPTLPRFSRTARSSRSISGLPESFGRGSPAAEVTIVLLLKAGLGHARAPSHSL